MENLIGRKVRGFKFEGESPYFVVGMYPFINKVGVIDNIIKNENKFRINFGGGDVYYYPLDQIKDHLVDEVPTLEEVRQYFKEAEIVESVFMNSRKNITKNILKDIHYHNKGYWMDFEHYEMVNIKLWDYAKGYAKIISYKQPEQIDLPIDCGIYKIAEILAMKKELQELREKLNNARKSLE